MKSAKSGLLCALLSVSLAGASFAAAVNYDEAIDGDLDQSNPPVFTLDVGVNTWVGSIGPTPTSNTQDAFFVNLPADMAIISIHWEYTPNGGDDSYFDMSGPVPAAPPFGTVVSHKVARAGDNITDVGFRYVNPLLPIMITGQYKCEVTTNFAISAENWKIWLTVERTTVSTESSTWGQIKALYR
jgi:hypothetical protein